MKEKRQSLKSKVAYVKKNWMLYIFFLMPALVLTIVFKYIPMGGLLIAFKDYNVIKGVFGSPWVGLEYFKRFLSSPDFMNYLMNTLKLSIYGLLWGFPVPIILALLLNRIRKEGIKKKPAPDTVNQVLEIFKMSNTQAIYIGDSEVDIMTAQNAQMPCISVTWGFKDKDFLLKNNAKIIINSPDEIISLLENQTR